MCGDASRPAAAGRSETASLDDIDVCAIDAANVASVPQRSPLRYPGGKTWLVRHVHKWLGSAGKPTVLLEPFCGGAIVSLTAVMDNLVDRCELVEIDPDVSAFWQAALDPHHSAALCDLIDKFELTRREVQELTDTPPADVVAHGFRTLVLNRTRRGGVLADGASLIRAGEAGRGVASRWYPQTIVSRLHEIKKYSDKIRIFPQQDGMQHIRSLTRRTGVAVFVDPPYTAGGTRAGRRLYSNHEVDHPEIFRMLADSQADFLMTYHATPLVIELYRKYGFHAVKVTMKNTNHARIPELLITRRHVFPTTRRE